MVCRTAFFILASMALVAACQSSRTTGAKVRIQHDDFAGAVRLAQEAIAADSADAEAWFYLGVACSHLDSVGAAYRSFQRSIELRPKDGRKREDAENNIQHNFAVHYNCGQIAYKERDYGTAAAEFDMATEADPRKTRAFYSLGVTYVALGNGDPGRYEQAIDLLQHVVAGSDSFEHYDDALATLGIAFARAGDDDAARRTFRQLIERNPAKYRAIEDVGRGYAVERRWDRAVIYLDLAAFAREQANDESANLYYEAGVAWQQLGDRDPTAGRRSAEYYEKAYQMEPDHFPLGLHVMKSWMAIREWERAALWGERYVNANPDDREAWRLLARCYNELGRREKAIRCLQRSLD